MKKSKFSCGGDFHGFNGGEPTKKKVFFCYLFSHFFLPGHLTALNFQFYPEKCSKEREKNYNDTCVCVCMCVMPTTLFFYDPFWLLFFRTYFEKNRNFRSRKTFLLLSHTHRMAINEKWPSSSVVDLWVCVCVQTKQSKKNQN